MYSKKKSLNFGQYVPNDKILNKKVPENPKYKHVKPAIDTGKNVRKQIDKLKEIQKNCQHKKNEVFKRVKCSHFFKLAVAVALEHLTNENHTVDPDSSPPEASKAKQPERPKAFANVLMGIGELDLVTEKKKMLMHPSPFKSPDPLPYLLLDVRDRDAFSQCHIVTAKNYPVAMLSRSTGSEIEELMHFKNLPHGVVIVYDEDETLAIRVATTLVERGYDNVYLLTGGLKLALEICPKNLTASNQTALSPVHTFSQNRHAPAQIAPKQYFSEEDVEVIENQITAYRSKVKNQPGFLSLYSLPSSRTSSVTRSHRHNASDSMSSPSCATSVSGRRSVASMANSGLIHQPPPSSQTSRQSCTYPSSKNKEPIFTKPFTIANAKSKLRKAPWK